MCLGERQLHLLGQQMDPFHAVGADALGRVGVEDDRQVELAGAKARQARTRGRLQDGELDVWMRALEPGERIEQDGRARRGERADP
jgi:hypothetical protein